eukprot:sb/3465201/
MHEFLISESMFGDVTPIPQYNRTRSPAPDHYPTSRSPAPDLYCSTSEELFCDLIPRTDPPEYNYYYLTPPSMLQKEDSVAEVTVMGRVDNATYTVDTPAQSPLPSWAPRYTSEALETSWTPREEHFMTPSTKQHNDTTQPFVTPGQSSRDITPPFKTPLLHQPGITPGLDHDTTSNTPGFDHEPTSNTPIQQQHPGVTPPLATPRRMCGEAFIRARCIPESHGYGHNDSMMVNISDTTLYTTNDVTNDLMTSRGDDVITVAAADSSSSSSPFLTGGAAASSFTSANDELNSSSLTDVGADESLTDELNCTLEVHSDTSSVDVGTQADLMSYVIPPLDPSTTTETIKRAIVSPSYPANKRMRVTARPPLHNHRKQRYQGNGYHSYHGNPVENTFNDNLQLHPENASCVIQ